MLDIFIIGPMTSADGKNQVIKDSIISIFNNLETDIAYQVKIPEELIGGYIPENVFYEMDVADFVIADITGRSPNVFYEIAMLQSMGTPLIFIDSLEHKDESIPFYLNHTNLLRVNKISLQELEKKLKPFIARFLNPKKFTNYSTSVISQYYGLPLVYISAVMGVAFGYFSNFIKPFLQRNTGAIAQRENYVNQLCIIKPTDLSSEDNYKNQLATILKDAVEKKYKCPASTRQIIFCPFSKGDKAFDVPAALFTLKKSPRLKKLRKKLNENQNVDHKLKIEAKEKFESQVIERFFNYLEFLIQEEADDLNDAYRFVTLKEL